MKKTKLYFAVLFKNAISYPFNTRDQSNLSHFLNALGLEKTYIQLNLEKYISFIDVG